MHHSPTTDTLPELLAPAGDMSRLDAVLRYGAHAVYLGGESMNLRAGTTGFSLDLLGQALAKAHLHGAKVYYCLNALPHQHSLQHVQVLLERLAHPFTCDHPPQDRNAFAQKEHHIDGLIIADPGVLRMARRLAPHIPVHLSTQANTTNSESAAFWRDMGASRLNLARELNCTAIKSIMQAVPDVEYETFVHGAMCLAVSGRCLMSAWMNRRSANLGQCAHPCRFDYRTTSLEQLHDEPNQADFALGVEERTRSGATAWTITQEEEWSHVWSPHDLSLVRYLGWFVARGVAAIKIEGRMKTAGYAAQVVDVYRTALHDLTLGYFRPALYQAELCNIATRPLSSGFFLPAGRRLTWPVAKKRLPLVGRITGREAKDCWQVAVLSPWDIRRPIHIIAPGLQRPELAFGQYGMENHRGEQSTTVHPGTQVLMRCAHPDLAVGLFLRATHP